MPLSENRKKLEEELQDSETQLDGDKYDEFDDNDDINNSGDLTDDDEAERRRRRAIVQKAMLKSHEQQKRAYSKSVELFEDLSDDPSGRRVSSSSRKYRSCRPRNGDRGISQSFSFDNTTMGKTPSKQKRQIRHSIQNIGLKKENSNIGKLLSIPPLDFISAGDKNEDEGSVLKENSSYKSFGFNFDGTSEGSGGDNNPTLIQEVKSSYLIKSTEKLPKHQTTTITSSDNKGKENEVVNEGSSSSTTSSSEDDGSLSSSSDDDDVDEYDEDEEGDGTRTSRRSDFTKVNREAFVQRMAKNESHAVTTWRFVVAVAMIFTAFFISPLVFLLLKNNNQNEHLNNFSLHVENIRSMTKSNFHQFQMELSDLSEMITLSQEKDQYRSDDDNHLPPTFPFITINQFEVYASNVRSKVTGAEMIIWAPFVHEQQLNAWINYSTTNGPLWYEYSKNITLKKLLYQNGTKAFLAGLKYSRLGNMNDTIGKLVWTASLNSFINDDSSDDSFGFGAIRSPGTETSLFGPVWHASPLPFRMDKLNFDLLQEHSIQNLGINIVPKLCEGLFSPVNASFGRIVKVALTDEVHETYHDEYIFNDSDEQVLLYRNGSKESSKNMISTFRPHSVHVQPVYDKLYKADANLVGIITTVVAWDRYLGNLAPDGVNGIDVVLTNNCGQVYTYRIRGQHAEYVGEGDFHETEYNFTRVIVPMSAYNNASILSEQGHCVYSFHVYSSLEYEEWTKTTKPQMFTTIVSCMLVVLACLFCAFDSSVRRQHIKVVNAAVRSNQVVASLFPSHVRDQLLSSDDQRDDTMNFSEHLMRNCTMKRKGDFLGLSEASSVGYLEDDDIHSTMFHNKPPIADLFADTTVMFADIAGFTAWSSAREPTQVFVLLETVYHGFDEIANRRRIFKVETVGDCYVAVAGLPEPRKDHAVAMCRFARDVLFRMRILTQKLQRTLGPETEELALRVGLHSGPVTAGVLRGQNSRFQLFGDTMNTAARMEQNGERNKIHLSKETAELIIGAGKTKWVIPRADKILAKGKGELETFWLVMRNNGKLTESTTGTNSSENDTMGSLAPDTTLTSKMSRLIDWNFDVLIRLLKQIVARRLVCPPEQKASVPDETRYTTKKSTIPFEEVSEVIEMPTFDDRILVRQPDPTSIELEEDVVTQVHNFVTNIAATYNNNPFHSFEHASHVTQSVIKLLSRIVAPTHYGAEFSDGEDTNHSITADTLHDHTYGITSDPLTQFACVLSSIIHDADHPGVPNAQLLKENTPASFYYKQKSIAEQNSVDLIWELLMQDEYKEFRNVIYKTDEELIRFRQLIVNCVMATDIVDKELKALRNIRWDRAFAPTEQRMESDANSRKATIVIEHLIQASDVAHTMQHWNIYRRWNEKFFTECYKAYLEGRSEKNPAEGWYQGEIGFFDFYIIPLAKKLKECGVFGVSSAEYLDYAVKNRQEWETRGQEVVSEMLEFAKRRLSEEGLCDPSLSCNEH